MRAEARPGGGGPRSANADRSSGNVAELRPMNHNTDPETAELLAEADAFLEQRAAEEARRAAWDAVRDRVDITSMDRVPLRRVEWLWRPVLASGKVVILAGPPGQAKSTAAVNIAATVTVGGRWPVDGTEASRGDVVILSAEDDPADTIGPRLLAAGADLSRVHVVRSALEFDDDGGVIRRGIDLSRDLDRLDEALRCIGNVALVVIDPLTAYLGRIDSHRTSDVRGVMAPLAELAEAHHVAILAISHLNKAGGQDAMMRVTGSLAFVAAARAAYVVCRDPEQDGRRLLLPIKNNLGDDATGYAYHVEGVTVADGIETSRIVWADERVTVTANEAMAAPADPDERTEREGAADWLRDVLADGPVPAKHIRKQCDDAGHAWRTVQRARTAIGATTRREGFGAGARWVWEIPHRCHNSPIGDIDSSTHALAPMDSMAPSDHGSDTEGAV